MKKHFVTFYSPGTFVAETTTMEIDSWDIEKAVELSKTIKERYGAVPYAFQFSTRERKAKDFDSKEAKRSNLYYLGGEIMSLEQLKEKNEPDNERLIRNMECNNYLRVVTTTKGWKWTRPLEDGDVVLDI